MEITKRLADLRNLYGYSQQEFADILGITRQTYIKIEQGTSSLSTNQLCQLAEKLGIPQEEFFYGVQDISKFKQMYLYILSKNIQSLTKTKLAKLLYIIDFRHYYDCFESMSGVLYKCKDYGPLANPFLELTDDMCDAGDISIDFLSEGAQIISANRKLQDSDFSLLSDGEKKEIDEICEIWGNRSTKQIVDFTHQQKPWMACRLGETIPYELILQEDPDNVYTPFTNNK